MSAIGAADCDLGPAFCQVRRLVRSYARCKELAFHQVELENEETDSPRKVPMNTDGAANRIRIPEPLAFTFLSCGRFQKSMDLCCIVW